MKKIIVIFALMLIVSTGYAKPPENSSDVIKHLEFLGYEVSMNSTRIKAKHSKNLNLLIRKYRGGILATAYFVSSEYGKSNKSSWLHLINKLNRKAAAARYYLDSDGDMLIEGYYPGDYNKKSFSAFLDAFNLERRHISEVSNEIKKYLE